MQFEMRKIAFNAPKAFSLEHEGVVLEGEIVRVGAKLFRLKACLKGELMLICDTSGKEFKKALMSRWFCIFQTGCGIRKAKVWILII